MRVSRTPEQIKEYQKKWREDNREKMRKYAKTYRDQHRDKPAHLMRKYGITVERKEEMYIEQKGICLVCNLPLKAVHDRDTCVDHCHATKRVRGLIHWYCNIIVGVYENKPVLLEQVRHYVMR
jgi:hypothetical protein